MAKKTPRPKTAKAKPSLMSRIVLVVNIFVASLLLISYLSPWISPSISTIPAFLGLAYPYLAALNLLFILFWLIIFKPYFLISLLCLAAGFTMASRHFQFHTRVALDDAQIIARVMSYNVRMFDFFDWKKSEESVEQILVDIGDQAPDILCLQEFYNNPGNKDNILEKVRDLEKLDHYHVEYDTTKGDHAYGIATFSAFPIISRGEILISERPKNHAIWTDIVVKEDTIRIFNFHLASYYFGRDDYAFVEKLQKNQDTRNWPKKSVQLLGKLNKAFRIRAEQAIILKDHITASPHPVIVCGDFNETPGSYVYRVLSKGLTDAFRKSGSGIGRTYAGTLPSYRIDYILLSPELLPVNFMTRGASVSDHLPISTYIFPDASNTSRK